MTEPLAVDERAVGAVGVLNVVAVGQQGDFDVAAAAAIALGKIGDEAAAKQLRSMLANKSRFKAAARSPGSPSPDGSWGSRSSWRPSLPTSRLRRSD